MTIERDTRESGYLYFPWKVAGRGLVQLCSGSLMERAKPYNLPVELARGTLNRLRNQASAWQTAGMVDSRELPTGPRKPRRRARPRRHLSDRIRKSRRTRPTRPFASASTPPTSSAANMPSKSSPFAARSKPLPRVLLGARLHAPPTGDAAARYLAAFNTVVVGTHWPDLEPRQGAFQWDATDRLVAWAHENNLRVCLGPLVQMDKHSLPDWLFLDDGYEEVQASVLNFIEAVVKRYRGKVQLWHVTARMNQDGAFAFSEEQRLRLVVEAVDRVRAIDSRTPMVVSFNQPWAEYIARKDQELTPINFADTLVRGELGLAGVGLEIHYGYWPGGTLPRDPLEVSRHARPLVANRRAADRLPLRPQQHGCRPARPPPRPSARRSAPRRRQPRLAASSSSSKLFPVLLAKHTVQAIVWDPWQDNQPHELPSSGLHDTSGHPKPALQTLIHHRRDLLG